MRKKLIIIGNGMSGLRFIETIISHDSDSFSIRSFGEEPTLHYNRVKLSSYLQNETNETSLFSHTDAWYKENRVHMHVNEQIIRIDTDKKLVYTNRNETFPYDQLVLATGSNPVQLNIPGHDKKGVYTFRTLQDAKDLKALAAKAQRGIIVGAGFLGLEAAYGLSKAGMDVNVIQRGDTLLTPQLDGTASLYLQRELEKRGISFYFDQSLESIKGKKRVERGILQDGTEIDTDLVLFTVGIKPNIEVAKESGIKTNRGIEVNDYMQTSAADVYAIGECIEHNGISYGLVPPVYEQAEIAASHICDKQKTAYNGSPSYSHLKIAGIDLFTAGSIEESEQTDSIVHADSTKPLYKKLVLQDDVIKGAILFGETSSADDISKRIIIQKALSFQEKNQLLSDKNMNEELIDSSPETIVCKCNQVNKQTILQHIAATKDPSPSTIQASTKASSSCGGCSGDVSGLLRVFDQCKHQARKETMCSCTSLEDEEVRELIYKGIWKDISDIISSVEWRTEGCDTCLPALHYYLSVHGQTELTSPPWIHKEETGAVTIESLPIKEDVTPIVLSTWIRLADIMSFSSLKMTGDRRVMLTDVSMNDAEMVCEATSTPMAAHPSAQLEPFSLKVPDGKSELEELEHFLFPLSFPAPFSIETTKTYPASVKRNGFTLVRSGDTWEMHVSGSEDRLILYVFSSADLKEITATIIQYYRESAHYKEAFADWMIRMSPPVIREILLSEEEREGLLYRMEKQVSDVWKMKKEMITL
ncbi:FAD-dependent oxidoreductase [Alteribacillus bidgolensis]|uniref:Nitrite reductase (NADH) large subunit n=1 Tax=Alteribacillus bidgolensis TaxID=930129 RepID=A0A1G8INT9_9BACI|nr:FAD-dependent oxidoreductase [Alteribacillus bidgolensis]SDI20457.1 nitrite reductase (NADH) large subunit [Alteribacillus bidgolensis]